MKRIQSVKLQHFKAFQEEQLFDFKGKNVLVHGNNGSGKSTLFWALYTFLQSSIKPNDDDVRKYFKHFLEGDTSTYQSLKNIHGEVADIPQIVVEIKEDNGNIKTYTIGDTPVATRPINNGDDTSIQELNAASDFINYKLLHNFFRANHKQEVNLWTVFERDIFPFLIDGTTSWLDKIKALTTDVPRTPRGNVVSQNRKRNYVSRIDALNTEIQAKLDEISRNANDFIKTHFFKNEDVVRVKMTFTKQFHFHRIRERMWDEGKQAYRLDNLRIKLLVELKKKAPSTEWQQVHRVQSFLNEAMLTKIAIGIRIGALRTRIQTTDFKILVLDDMLISLDMSNRMSIVPILLDTSPTGIFRDFQKIILTHDLGFYELIKRYAPPQDWEFLKFHSNDDIKVAPRVRNDKSRIEKAKAFLMDGEYDACGNEIRKETEAVLNKYLKGLNLAAEEGVFEPLMNKLKKALKQVEADQYRRFNGLITNRNIDAGIVGRLNTDFTTAADLTPQEKGQLRGLRSAVTQYLVQQANTNNDKARILRETKDILKRIMNPASHANFTPLYQAELQKAIDNVVELQTLLNRQVTP